jgi:ribosomal protein S18 acetylase RimI-like enzyme
MLLLHAPFRRARPEDARAVAELIDMAGGGVRSLLWEAEAAEGEGPLDVGARLVAQPAGHLSFANAVVGDEGGRVTCVLFGYRSEIELSDLADAPDILHPVIRLAAQAPDTWHVDSVAVAPPFRRRGLGTRLLRIADALAAEEGLTQTSLIVAEANEGARRLYEREGYRCVAREPSAPHPRLPARGDWLLMTRPVVPQG